MRILIIPSIYSAARLPDICVAKDYGDDYVWKGAIAGFLAEL